MRSIAASLAALLLWAPNTVLGADINVLSAAGIRGVVVEIGLQFEHSTGHKIVAKYVGGPVVRQTIMADENFDVAISQPAEIDRLIKDAKINPRTRADIAYSGMGLGVRKGAPKPQINSSDSFKAALIKAKSIAYAGDGASGEFFLKLFERLGIADIVKPKLKSMPAGTPAAEAVARGEAEIVLLSVPSILAVPGVDLVSPLPADIQYYSGFAAGIVATTKQPAASEAFITLLKSPSAAPVIKKNGLEAGAPKQN